MIAQSAQCDGAGTGADEGELATRGGQGRGGKILSGLCGGLVGALITSVVTAWVGLQSIDSVAHSAATDRSITAYLEMQDALSRAMSVESRIDIPVRLGVNTIMATPTPIDSTLIEALRVAVSDVAVKSHAVNAFGRDDSIKTISYELAEYYDRYYDRVSEIVSARYAMSLPNASVDFERGRLLRAMQDLGGDNLGVLRCDRTAGKCWGDTTYGGAGEPPVKSDAGGYTLRTTREVEKELNTAVAEAISRERGQTAAYRTSGLPPEVP